VEDPDLVKEFVKTWAKYCQLLGSAKQPALSDLSKEPALHQEVESLYDSELRDPGGCRRVALKLAMAEFKVRLEHL
jgi:hypothetical protein